MNEMTLRVARAICLGGIRNPATVCTYPQCGCRNATVKAEAAIKAMRNPPREMLDEVIQRLGDGSTFSHWDTMIDVILDHT